MFVFYAACVWCGPSTNPPLSLLNLNTHTSTLMPDNQEDIVSIPVPFILGTTSRSELTELTCKQELQVTSSQLLVICLTEISGLDLRLEDLEIVDNSGLEVYFCRVDNASIQYCVTQRKHTSSHKNTWSTRWQHTTTAGKTTRNRVVVSGLSPSEVSACSLMIKEFCGGKAGWNDRAIFIETESRALRPEFGPLAKLSNRLKEEFDLC